MSRLTALLVVPLVLAGAAQAQGGRGAVDWTTAGNDAQRSFWVRSDAKISVENLQKPGFQLLWKVKLASSPSAPVLFDRYIGYRGFRSLAVAGSSSDKVFALDTDLGRLEWQVQLKTLAVPPPSPPCPGGMTAGLTRPTTAASAVVPAARGGGRGGPAKSGVGEPGQGAVTLAQVIAANAAPDAAAGRRGGGARMPSYVHALASDGMFHTLYVSNGEEPQPAVRFLPANTNAQGLIVVDNVAYAATLGRCGGIPDAVWALDLATNAVKIWNPAAGGIAGTTGPSFGPDGTLYITTTAGELVALEPKTLNLKGSFATDRAEFASSPLVFEFKDKILIAATTKNGRLRLFDAASPVATLPQAPIDSKAAPGALASWQDPAGTRWLLAPVADSIAAWKVTEKNGGPSLEAGWIARQISSAMTPTIVNGVVFAASGGGPKRSGRAVLFAYDGLTGKELWNSGSTMTASAAGGGLSAGGSQMYVGTYDGTLYAFGFPMEH